MTIAENEVYVATPPEDHKTWKRKKMRRIISIVNGLVCYSTGGNQNKFCKEKTFEKWIAKPYVERVH